MTENPKRQIDADQRKENGPLPAAILLFIGVAMMTGCQDSSPVESSGSSGSETSGTRMDRDTAIRFEDVTQQTGISFTYRDGQEAGFSTILESIGGGVATFDFDNDGWLDLFFPGGGSFTSEKEIIGRKPGLYRNQGDWQFSEVTHSAAIDRSPYYSHGTAVCDYDNDGFRDLLVTGYGGLVLFHNQGDGTFIEITRKAGLKDKLWSTSAAWGDVDGDGFSDLYVTHYVNWSFENHPFCPGPEGQREVCSPNDFDPLPDVLYRNKGDGTFQNASQKAGLREDGKGLGVLIADLNLNGVVDIYVTNDQTMNFLYRNNGRFPLEEIGLQSGAGFSLYGDPEGSMGADLCDFNGDGLLDIGVMNYENEHFALYRNDGDCMFQHVSQSTGLTAAGELRVGWGPQFCDFDRDGDEDLFIANGHVIRYPVRSPVKQKPLLFENRQRGRFANVTNQGGRCLTISHIGRGSAVGDYDRDGVPDLVVNYINEPAGIYENRSTSAGHWLSVKLVGRCSSHDAIGAVVYVKTEQEKFIRQHVGGAGYLSSNDPHLFFGLGPAERVERVEIDWPSGIKQQVENLSTDQNLIVREPPTADSSGAWFKQSLHLPH